MMSEGSLRIIEVFSQVASSIATFAAVAIALYFSRRDFVSKVDLSLSYRELWQLGRGKLADIVCISLVNIGHRPVTLTSLYWSVGLHLPLLPGRIKRRYAIQTIEPSQYHQITLPHRLQEGETAQIVFGIEENDHWFLHSMVPFLKEMPRWLHHTLRLSASLSNGKTFRCKPDSAFRKQIEKCLKRKSPADAASH